MSDLRTKRIQPLDGIRVLEFATLLPGPLAGLMLAEAGAEVVKVERPEGDELRAYRPRAGRDSLSFAVLNRGKRSLTVDLKDPQQREALLPLVREADILIEQFRPGVMDRLHMGHDDLSRINPRLIYCSITGYGQNGPNALRAGHDLNYQAEAGLLSLSAGRDGAPVLPSALFGDIAGGSLPAVMNILLALRLRDMTGKGSRLDISITDNLFTFPYSSVAAGLSLDVWPVAGQDRLSGGSPRYRLYETRDGRHLAAAPLETRFWLNFCEAIGLEPSLRDDALNPSATIAAVSRIMRQRDAARWMETFEGADVCVSLVADLREALESRPGADTGTTGDGGTVAPAMRLPIADGFRDGESHKNYPPLGEMGPASPQG